MRDSALIDANYELVRVVCPWCSGQNTFNRVSDIGDLEPISHREVTCQAADCRQAFSINGDDASPAYKMFYYGSYDFITEKRYSFAILSVVQALEVFFAHAVRELWLLKVFKRRGFRDLEELNDALRLLYAKTKTFPYIDMRNLFLLAALQPRPQTIADGRRLIEAIACKQRTPTNETIAAAPARLRGLLYSLKECTLHETRNEIVHKHAYRPSRDEAIQAIEKVGDILIPLASRLKVEFASF